jgi:hypothetical protein
MNLMSHPSLKLLVRVVLVAGLLLAGSLIAPAQTAGYDFLQTGNGASADLSNFGLGNVPLTGVPIMASTGNTDTIMHRTQNGPGVVAVNVYALFMKNSGAVTFNGTAADVYITINNSAGGVPATTLPQPDALPLSKGTVTIFDNFTFDSSITINADVIIVKAGAGVNGAPLAHGPAKAITLTSKGSPWSSTPPAGYPSVPSLPSGGFYPRPVHTGPHPVIPGSCGGITPASPTGQAAIAKCIAAA